MTLLAVIDLNKSYGGIQAAQNVSFELARGEMLALIGPNGAGKSTTFAMVGGQLRPDAGRVVLDGAEVTGMPPRTLAHKGVGRTFQVAAIFGSMTVVENVQMAIAARHGRTWAVWGRARTRFREEALAVLAIVGMDAQANQLCSALSYGDVKRSELAIALAGNPGLLLMDEPTAGMASRERGALMELTARLAQERQIGVLFTEHDMDAVFSHANRILVLVRGQIIAQGRPGEVRSDPEVKRLYLGESGATAADTAKRRTSDVLS